MSPAATVGATRTESDTFGPVEIPADWLWGAQRLRLGRTSRKPCPSRRLGLHQADAPPCARSRLRPFPYHFRILAERFFNKLKHFRAVATRYEKHDANYLAIVKLAATRIWLRAYESMT